MSDDLSLSDHRYSPYIAAELEVNGERMSLASLSPGRMVLRNAKPHSAARGVLRTTVDKHVTVRHVELPEGIDPQRREQPFRVLQTVDAVA